MRAIKKTKRYRCGLAAILVFCLALICSLFVPQVNVASADAVDYKTVFIGDKIEASDYTLTYNGGTVKAESMRVVYPSGGVYGGEGFTVEQAGIYEITYYATVGNERIEETQPYKALRQPQDIIYSTNGATIGYGEYVVENPVVPAKTGIKGALVTFKAGTSIIFDTKVPTKNLTANYDILSMIVMPSKFRETDFERLTVKVSDAENPDNFVEIIIDSSNTLDGDGQVSYVKAGANGQQAGGYEGATYHTRNYGTQVEHSFRGFGRKAEDRADYTLSKQIVTVAIDNESKKVYCGPVTNTSTDKLMVNDLDDMTRFKSSPWGGFTSDEVVVQVSAGMFVKGEGQVVITQFGGYSLSKEINKMPYIADTEAPQITLQYDESKEPPIATEGKKFPIIPFTAKDRLDKQVKTNVYVYYKDVNGNTINVSTDGTSFTPKYAGEYTVVYTAEDYSGNFASKEIVIQAVETSPEIFIALDEVNQSAPVYNTVSIKYASDISVFGGNGDLKAERAVYSPSGMLLDVKDSILLTEVGDYKVVYKVTDYLGNVKYGVVTVTSEALADPTFITEPKFEKTLIAGFTYDLPNAFVIETVDGKVVELDYVIKVNGEVANGQFTASGESVVIEYVADGETGTTLWTVEIPVVDTEKGKYQSKYFHAADGASVTDTKNYLLFSWTKASSAEFIKELYSDGFSLIFSYNQNDPEDPNGANQMLSKTFTIVLADVADRNLTVTFTFTYEASSNTWAIQFNGKGDKIPFVISKNSVSFSLASDGFGILDASGTSVGNIKYFDNGEVFTGFSSAVYLSMEFGEVEEGQVSSICLTNLCNQVMGYKKKSQDNAKDEIKPVIFLTEEFQIRQKLGTEAKIPTAIAYDVLGQIVEFTIKVEMMPDKTLLASGSATEPVKVLLNKSGNYLVTYYAKDSNGKSSELSYSMMVADETAPTLTVNGSLRSEYKVGDKISIPTYSATDNGETCCVQVELILPNNEVRLLQYNENGEVISLLSSENKLYNSSFKADENTFIAEKTGKYILRFLAYDEYYNTVVKMITFTVK